MLLLGKLQHYVSALVCEVVMHFNATFLHDGKTESQYTRFEFLHTLGLLWSGDPLSDQKASPVVSSCLCDDFMQEV